MIEFHNPLFADFWSEEFRWWKAWSTHKRVSFSLLTYSNFYLQLSSGKKIYHFGQFDLWKHSKIQSICYCHSPETFLVVGSVVNHASHQKKLFFAPHTLKLLLTASVRKNSLPHRSVWLWKILKFYPYTIATPLRHSWLWEVWSTTLPTKKCLFFAPHTLKLIPTASIMYKIFTT